VHSVSSATSVECKRPNHDKEGGHLKYRTGGLPAGEPEEYQS
jgi:hypothetical protein